MRGYFWALWTENGGNRPELNSGHQKSLFEINVRNLKPFLKWIFRPLLFWKRSKTLLLIWKFPLFYFILCTISIFCILWSQLRAWNMVDVWLCHLQRVLKASRTGRFDAYVFHPAVQFPFSKVNNDWGLECFYKVSWFNNDYELAIDVHILHMLVTQQRRELSVYYVLVIPNYHLDNAFWFQAWLFWNRRFSKKGWLKRMQRRLWSKFSRMVTLVLIRTPILACLRSHWIVS